jgi:PPOX class probable F420-dependent enzyme
MAKLTDAQAEVVKGSRSFASLATLRKDGSPHITPIWVDYDGENVVINTAQGRAKTSHIRRDPRVSISIYDQDNPYRYVEVSGTAEIADEGDEAWEHIDKMHRKYHGSGEYPRGGPQRVLVRIHPEKVSTMGFEDE